jgi:hypothetical protein
MIHRRLAVATRVAKLVSAAGFPNQYFVGCAFSFVPFVCVAIRSVAIAPATARCARNPGSWSGGSRKTGFKPLFMPVRQGMVFHSVQGALQGPPGRKTVGAEAHAGEVPAAGPWRSVVSAAGFLSRRPYGQHRLNSHYLLPWSIQPPYPEGLGGTLCRCHKSHRLGEGPGEHHLRLPVGSVRRQ